MCTRVSITGLASWHRLQTHSMTSRMQGCMFHSSTLHPTQPMTMCTLQTHTRSTALAGRIIVSMHACACTYSAAHAHTRATDAITTQAKVIWFKFVLSFKLSAVHQQRWQPWTTIVHHHRAPPYALINALRRGCDRLAQSMVHIARYQTHVEWGAAPFMAVSHITPDHNNKGLQADQ